jgi:hypothetical protein
MKTIESKSHGLLYVLSEERVGAMTVYCCEDWQGRRIWCSRKTEPVKQAA